MTRRVLLVAGEASGDLHGAALVREMRRLVPDLDVSGVGGEQLRTAGMRILTDTASIQTMGFVETFGTLGRLARAYWGLRRALSQSPPDLVVLVDFPEFNLRLARQAKRLGIPVFYFIAPQVWAWRRGRVRKILRRVDRLAVVFPFEVALYNDGRARAEFVGHPLLDLVSTTRSREETCAAHGLLPERPVLALLPGSREQEIRHLLRPMLEAANELCREGWQAVLALAPRLARDDVLRVAGDVADVAVVENDTYNVISAADAVVVASGTATLETALLARPMVIVYRVTAMTYALARLLVRVDAIGMPNIILGREAFPELIQDAVRPAIIAAAVRRVAGDGTEIKSALAQVREKLGQPGAAARAARLAVGLMS